MKKYLYSLFSATIVSAAVLFSACQSPVAEGSTPELTGTESRSAAAIESTPVRLISAVPFNYAVSGMTYNNTTFTVHAKNIGTSASRVVSIHYKNGATWSTTPMTKTYDYGTHSVYSLTLGSSSYEFVVKYENSTGTFWDNNGGANYKVAAWSTTPPFQAGAVGGNVGLVAATNKVALESTYYGADYIYSYTINATIAVEDLSYNKRVALRMSFNNGATWQDVDAVYFSTSSTGGGQKVQTWKVNNFFYLAHPLTNDIKFAVFYQNKDTGIWYWDNNFGQNYTLPKGTKGTTTEVR